MTSIITNNIAAMFRLLIALLFLLLPLYAEAQERFVLSKLTHDFGEIEERGGDVQCEFIIKNISNKPLVLIRAKSTCSCTTVKYSRKPIAADYVDTLRVTFDPRFRSGRTQKSINLYIAGEDKPTKLTICADVD